MGVALQRRDAVAITITVDYVAIGKCSMSKFFR